MSGPAYPGAPDPDGLDFSSLPDPVDLTDAQRIKLVVYALTNEEGPVTRFVAAYEQATMDGGMHLAYAATDDPPWISLGLARYMDRALEDEVSDAEDD